MKYIHEYSCDERARILQSYDLSGYPTNKDLCHGIADYVYRRCEQLIPDKLKEVFRERGLADDFKQEIKDHLEFCTSLKQLSDQNEIVQESNHKSLQRMLNIVNGICTENKFWGYTKAAQEYQKQRLHTVSTDFHLKVVAGTNKPLLLNVLLDLSLSGANNQLF